MNRGLSHDRLNEDDAFTFHPDKKVLLLMGHLIDTPPQDAYSGAAVELSPAAGSGLRSESLLLFYTDFTS